MRVASVPDENDASNIVATQVLKDSKHLRGSDVMGVQAPIEIEPLPVARDAKGTDRGEANPHRTIILRV